MKQSEVELTQLTQLDHLQTTIGHLKRQKRQKTTNKSVPRTKLSDTSNSTLRKNRSNDKHSESPSLQNTEAFEPAMNKFEGKTNGKSLLNHSLQNRISSSQPPSAPEEDISILQHRKNKRKNEYLIQVGPQNYLFSHDQVVKNPKLFQSAVKYYERKMKEWISEL